MTTVGLVAAARTISGLTARRCLKYTGHAGMPMHQIVEVVKTLTALAVGILRRWQILLGDTTHKWRIANPPPVVRVGATAPTLELGTGVSCQKAELARPLQQ